MNNRRDSSAAAQPQVMQNLKAEITLMCQTGGYFESKQRHSMLDNHSAEYELASERSSRREAMANKYLDLLEKTNLSSHILLNSQPGYSSHAGLLG
jgi:hypothetical protein